MSILIVLFAAPFLIAALLLAVLLRSISGLDDEFQPRRPARP